MLAHLNSRITDPGLNKLGHMAQLVERSLSTYRYAKGPGFDSQSVHGMVLWSYIHTFGHMAQLVERSLSIYRYAKGPGFDSQSVQLSCDSGQVVRIQPFQG